MHLTITHVVIVHLTITHVVIVHLTITHVVIVHLIITHVVIVHLIVTHTRCLHDLMDLGASSDITRHRYRHERIIINGGDIEVGRPHRDT